MPGYDSRPPCQRPCRSWNGWIAPTSAVVSSVPSRTWTVRPYTGPSPRVRGKREASTRQLRGVRSIPARAEQDPGGRVVRQIGKRVIPCALLDWARFGAVKQDGRAV